MEKNVNNLRNLEDWFVQIIEPVPRPGTVNSVYMWIQRENLKYMNGRSIYCHPILVDHLLRSSISGAQLHHNYRKAVSLIKKISIEEWKVPIGRTLPFLSHDLIDTIPNDDDIIEVDP